MSNWMRLPCRLGHHRMKMYFEDAGKWAFMKNMGMPGSIASETEAQIQAAADTYAP